jgi:hypothetical protein
MNQDVVRFEISVHDVVLIEHFEGFDDLRKVV